jgi:hypothetical protein
VQCRPGFVGYSWQWYADHCDQLVDGPDLLLSHMASVEERLHSSRAFSSAIRTARTSRPSTGWRGAVAERPATTVRHAVEEWPHNVERQGEDHCGVLVRPELQQRLQIAQLQ